MTTVAISTRDIAASYVLIQATRWHLLSRSGGITLPRASGLCFYFWLSRDLSICQLWQGTRPLIALKQANLGDPKNGRALYYSRFVVHT